MAGDLPISDPDDPLLGYSGVSLFPRTFRDSSTITKPSGYDSTESVHSILKSMALRSPTKLAEQARFILDGGSELLNSNFPSNLVSENKSGFIAEKHNKNPPERRPALGRKRARFSLKPDSSQPTMVLEPSLDIDMLQDPEEYFLAHEKLENTKKELERQRGGVLMDLNQHNSSKTTRRRRPGILGRSVSYKHHYSSIIPENDENLVPSPASIEQEMVSLANYSSQVEMVDPNVTLQEIELTETVDPNVESQERELTVSMTKAEHKVDGILGELLSGNCDALDGHGALTLLQERLQIKPIDLDKLCLPELHDIPRNDFKSSGGNWLRNRDSLLDMKTMLKGISSKTPIKNGQVAESTLHSPASPTPPKSPFASISLLKRRILHSNLTGDPFSVLNLSPPRNSSASNDKQYDKTDDGKEHSFSEKLESLIHEGDGVSGASTGSIKVVHVITGDSTPPSVVHKNGTPSENAVANDSGRLGLGVNSGLSGSHVDLDVNIRSHDPHDDLRRLNADIDVQIMETNGLEEMVGDILHEEGPYAHPDHNTEDSILEKLNGGESCVDDDVRRLNTDRDVQINETNELVDMVGDMLQEEPCAHSEEIIEDSRLEKLNDEDVRRLNTESDARINKTNELEDMVGDMLQKEEARAHSEENIDDSTPEKLNDDDVRRLNTDSNVRTNELADMEEGPHAHPDQNTEDSTLEKLNGGESHLGQPTFAAVETQDRDWPLQTADKDPEQDTEEVLEPSHESVDERSREKAPLRKERKRKEISRRQSLAEAGTLWSSGVRRSTRIRMRPLEYWKGERFLYGRIHQSLTSVIGVKYVSPAKGDGKATLKVKSYVSDEYKELVDLAALH